VATHEADAADVYKDMMVAGSAEDVITTAVFTGHPATYLDHQSLRKASIRTIYRPTGNHRSCRMAMIYRKPGGTFGAPVKGSMR
jgi:NAD(P)H-dependent flavin oxidoreductase YrpB (nitropropane dioxygenase family)